MAWCPIGNPACRTHAFFESLAFFIHLSGRFGLACCYISNGRASACGGAIDMTCCIWDVVQV
jgi:hypothetical protein